MLRFLHVRRAISYIFLAKSVFGCAFTVLTVCGVTLPFFGVDFTPHRELAAGSLGGILGVVVALKS